MEPRRRISGLNRRRRGRNRGSWIRPRRGRRKGIRFGGLAREKRVKRGGEDGSPNKEESLAEIALHSAKANPTPETIKKKPCTCGGGGGELDATPSIPIEPSPGE